MREYLIHNVVHILGTIMIEAGIDGISRGNNLVGMMRVLNQLQFVPLDQRAEEGSTGVEPWLRSWWGGRLTIMRPVDWF